MDTLIEDTSIEKTLVKFSSQLDQTLFTLIKEISQNQGRKLQDVFEEAIKDYIDKFNSGKSRPCVIKEFNNSILAYNSCYEKLHPD